MNRIKEIRESKGVSQEKLAEMMETNVATVQAWEEGKTVPNQAMLFVLAVKLRCTEDQLLGLEEGVGTALDAPMPPHKEKRSPRNPIICAHCRSNNLAFVTEYHREIGLQIFAFIVGILTAILALYVFSSQRYDNSLVVLIFLALLFVALEIIILINESKTHVECICKDCGHTWLHN